MQEIKTIEQLRKNPKINLYPFTSILINNNLTQKIHIKNKSYIKARDDNFSWNN